MARYWYNSAVQRMGLGILFLALSLFAVAGQCAAQRVVVDQLGREVILPSRVERVVCLAPSLTEIVYDLGEGARVVGVTSYANRPEAARSIPRVGSYVRLDVELIAALAPDLCLAIKDGNPLDAINKIRSLGIPVFAVDPRSIDSVMQSIRLIGQALDVADKSAVLVAGMDRRITALKDRVAGVRHHPRVFYQIGVAPIVTVGRGSFVHELITTAGGRNVVTSSIPYPRLTMEEIVALAPEVVVLSTMGGERDVREVRQQLGKWPSIPAVRDGRIHRVDSDVFDRPSPRLTTALEELAAILHPHLFERHTSGSGS